MNFIALETRRLSLKGLTPEDMSYIFGHLAKDDIKKVLGHRSEEEYLTEEKKYLQGYASYNRRFVLFLMTDKSSGQIIGRCGLHNWNPDHFRSEIGYVMLEDDFKRKGLMTEAVEAIIHYGFTQLHLNRIEALVGPNNIPSLRIMEIFGFEKEGVLQQHYRVGDVFEDSVVFGLLREKMPINS